MGKRKLKNGTRDLAKPKGDVTLAGMPGLAPVQKRQPNGAKYRSPQDRADPGADQVALKARCAHQGRRPTAEAIRDARAQYWGCEAGKAIAAAVRDHQERLDLFDAAQHMRKVVVRHDQAIGVPSRHATCLRLLLPVPALEADAETPPQSIELARSTDEEKQRQSTSALMAMEGWLGCTDKAARSEALRVVLGDEVCCDPVGLISALRCVQDGVKGNRMVWRGRG
jgi:hypothetical protein